MKAESKAEVAVYVALEGGALALGAELAVGAHEHRSGKTVLELDEGVLGREEPGNGVNHDGRVRGAVTIGGVAADARPIRVSVEEKADSVEGAFDAARDARPELEDAKLFVDECLLVVVRGDSADSLLRGELEEELAKAKGAGAAAAAVLGDPEQLGSEEVRVGPQGDLYVSYSINKSIQRIKYDLIFERWKKMICCDAGHPAA
jgi:hypothetical protein